MDRILMDEFYERLRAGGIEALAASHIDECDKLKQRYEDAADILIESLNLKDLFDHSRQLTAEEKVQWTLFDNVARHGFVYVLALMKGAYMVGAEDRERMLR